MWLVVLQDTTTQNKASDWLIANFEYGKPIKRACQLIIVYDVNDFEK